MKNEYIDFLDSVENKNIKEARRYSIKILDRQNIDLDAIKDIESLIKIFNSDINSKNTAKILKNTIEEYSRYSDNMELYSLVCQIDVNKIWDTIKHNSRPVLFLYPEFKKIYDDLKYERNNDYIQALWLSVFEGIYNEDLSVLSNLRASDIDRNTVSLRDNNGGIFQIEISDELVNKLIKVSKINEWQRQNRHGYFSIQIDGKYSDSVFKVEHRADVSEKSYMKSYRLKFETITKYYVGYAVSIKNIYISGIIYRISREMEKIGLDFMTALSFNDPKGVKIIRNELNKSYYKSKKEHFKQYVLSHNFITDLTIR